MAVLSVMSIELRFLACSRGATRGRATGLRGLCFALEWVKISVSFPGVTTQKADETLEKIRMSLPRVKRE
jgi:hypothetical protein